MTAEPGRPVVVVTGAASGIGAACVDRFARESWRTAGVDLKASNCDVSVQVDVADRADTHRAVDEALHKLGRIDALVTAADHVRSDAFVTDITHELWDRSLAVILGGTANAIAAVLPHMLDQGSGAIVTLSSEQALGGGTTDLHNSAAKGAVLGLVKSLAVELAPTPIRVNAVAVGPTDDSSPVPGSLERRPPCGDSLPLRRLVSPEEIAHAVWYLVSEGGIYCGEVL